MSEVRLTHIGGPTVLLEFEGWRLLTDPTFDPPGRAYRVAPGARTRKLTGPAVPAADLGPIDAVLLSHVQHADNLDDTGRDLLGEADTVVTTPSGARSLGDDTRGLEPWDSIALDHPDRPTVEVTATPARHGPPGSRFLVGDSTGFALQWEGQEHGVLWISGDTVLYDGVRSIGGRFDVGTAVVHLGSARFRVTGPIRYTMTAADAVTLARQLRPRALVPVHCDGWSHFSEPRDAAAKVLAASDVADLVVWPTLGRPASLPV